MGLELSNTPQEGSRMLAIIKKRSRKMPQGKDVWPYIFLLPFFLIYFTFNFYPIIYTFIISLHKWDGFTDAVFTGFTNYISIFTKDPYFLKSIKNTLIFMVIDIPLVVGGGIVMAAILNSKILKFSTVFRWTTFLPYLTIPVAIGILFLLIFDWNMGLFNRILLTIGIIKEGINFLGVPALARGTIILMIFWKYLGYHMIFFNAGILGISNELYEAADVDGASVFTKFFRITVPMLRPILEFLLVMNIIWGFQLFDEPKVLFSSWASSGGSVPAAGGPQRSALTAIWNLYDTTFGTQMQYGKGAAIAYGLFLFILVFSIVTQMIIRLRNKGEV
jgi:multiple sugar transport system permease protein/cellobiose transport system permease protein